MKKENMNRRMLQEHELSEFSGGIRLDPKKIIEWIIDQITPDFIIQT
jgi:hypothetical protein